MLRRRRLLDAIVIMSLVTMGAAGAAFADPKGTPPGQAKKGATTSAPTAGGALPTHLPPSAFRVPHAGRETWGLIRGGSGEEATAMRAVYFFPGQLPAPAEFLNGLWSQIPASTNYLHFDDATLVGVAARNGIIADIVAAHANTIVMSDWEEVIAPDRPDFADLGGSNPFADADGPMKPTHVSYERLFAAVADARAAGADLGIVPAIEGDPQTGALPCGGEPSASLPLDAHHQVSPWLKDAIDRLVRGFLANPAHPEWRDAWRQMHDQNGTLRYVINLVHFGARSVDGDEKTTALELAAVLDGLAAHAVAGLPARDHVLIGFTIDPWSSVSELGSPAPGCPRPYAPRPSEAGELASAESLLGIQAFNPEITIAGRDPQHLDFDPTYPDSDLNACCWDASGAPAPCFGRFLQPTCTDNNLTIWGPSLEQWKRDWYAKWLEQTSGPPVMLDVSSGYDFHVFGWPESQNHPVGLYGDNSWDGVNDSWRNHLSAMKRHYRNGRTVSGIVYNAWNGFAEGFAAVPYRWVTVPGATEPQIRTTASDWASLQLSVDPRFCDHVQFADGAFTGVHVYGDICDLWQCLGAEDGFGAPTEGEEDTPHGAILEGTHKLLGLGGANRIPRKTEFAGGGTIYWSLTTGAHEVHGAINRRYHELHEDLGALGLPVSDDLDDPTVEGGRISWFEHGAIRWYPGIDDGIESFDCGRRRNMGNIACPNPLDAQ